MGPTWLIGSLILLAGAATAGVYVVLRAQRPRAEPIYHFRCPACGQKLRYSASRAGRAAICTRCSQRLTLPLKSSSNDSRPHTPAQEAERRAMALRG